MAELPKIKTKLVLTYEDGAIRGTVTLFVPYGERIAAQSYELPPEELQACLSTCAALADKVTEAQAMHVYGVTFEALAVATRMKEDGI